MSSLFNITQKHLELLNALEDSIMENDVPDDDIVAQLNISETEAKDKIMSYYYFIRHKEADINLIDEEIKRLKDLKETKENLIKRLKDNVNIALQAFGERTDKGNYKMDLGTVKVWNVFHKPLIVNDEFCDRRFILSKIKDKFDDDHLVLITEAVGDQIETIEEVDKTALKNYLLDGKDISNAYIDKQASYVRFK